MVTSGVALTEHDLPAGAGTVHVVEAGDPKGQPVVLLHGYPECWQEWTRVIELAAAEPAGAIAPDVGVRVIALDLPGIGQSVSAPTDGRKSAIAEVVHEVVEHLGLDRPLIVGHDAGGMVAYAYLRAYAEEVSGVVIMDVVIPGLPPWEEVLANPHVWHFAFHAIPELPEHLGRGKQREYFDYFWGATTANPDGITPTLRAAHAVAYADDRALTAGFDLYRAMRADAEENTATAGGPAIDTPLLYLRGEHEGGDMDAYVGGFHGAGIRNVDDARVAGSGHYAPEESPEAVWSLIRDFARRH